MAPWRQSLWQALSWLANGLSRPRPLWQLLTALSVVVALPVLTLSGIVIWRLVEQNALQHEQRLSQLVEDLANDIDRQLDLMSGMLQALAAMPILQQRDFSAFHARARDAIAGRDMGVILIEPSGRQLANTYVNYGTLLPDTPDLETVQRVLESGKMEVSNLFIGRVTGRPSLNVTLPISYENRLTYILILAFTPDLIREIASDQQLPVGWSSGVADANLRIITRNPGHEEFAGKPLPAGAPVRRRDTMSTTVNLLGEPSLRAVRTTKRAPWTVVSTVEKRIVTASAWQAARQLLGVGVVLVAMAAAGAGWLGRKVAADISRLVESSRLLGTNRALESQNGLVSEINVVSQGLAASTRRREALVAEMSRQRNYLELVLKTVPSIIYIYDLKERRTIYISGEVQASLGYAPSELTEINDPLAKLVDPDFLPAIAEHYRALMLAADTDTRTIEYRLRHKDGGPRWLLSVDRSWQRDELGNLVQVLGIAMDVTERKRVEMQVARLASIAVAAHDALIGIDVNGVIDAWNPGAERLFGYTAAEAIGQPAHLLTDGKMKGEQTQLLKRVMAGESIGQFETQRRRKDGTEIAVALSFAPVRAPDGTICGVVKAAFDISPRKHWEQQQALLKRELAHRVKNSFAVLQAIMRATLREARDPAAFIESFTGRMQSMTASFDILLAREWAAADLESLAQQQLAAFSSAQADAVRISGPRVELPPELAVPVGLLLHELGTNAAKYGALSNPDGTVTLSWSVVEEAGEKQVLLEWREQGGPPVVAPTRIGFGSTLIERGLSQARVQRRFEPSGVVCTIDLKFPKK